MKSRSDPFVAAYERLNNAQKKAVDTVEGPVMVIAGPGSGKTEILSLRVANILRLTHATPDNILCLTFTESAATNMRQRLATLIGERAYRVAIHTFHSFAVEVISRHPEYFYGGAYMSPADDLTRMEIVEDALRALSHGHPLRSEHPEQGFVFRRPVMEVIERAKKAGLEPREFAAVIAANEEDYMLLNPFIHRMFSGRLSKKEFPQIETVLRDIQKVASQRPITLVSHAPWKPYARVVADSLAAAYQEAQETDSTTPLSVWKSSWTEATEDGQRVLKDGGDRLLRMQEVGRIYETYQRELFARGFYDFDDMILDVIEAIETHAALRAYVQEQYQYVLVDEFQDTNDAQMRLVRSIVDSPVNEGRPNLMVVGDDDQAIYRFQGADVSNILSFTAQWKDVAVVTMADNYRSTQSILNAAETVIVRGQDRLARLLPGVEKKLRAAHKGLSEGSIRHVSLPSSPHEYHFVASEIHRMITVEGVSPDSIAVISRKHRQLEELVPYLKTVSVPIRYEREQNVLEEPHIKQLILLARFVASIADGKGDEADELLPSILSFPFWGIERVVVWELSIQAKRAHGGSWLAAMRQYNDLRVQAIASFLIDLAGDAKTEPLEYVLDKLIGAEGTVLEEDEDEVRETATSQKGNFVSPFKRYYFSKERFTHARADYLSFLSSLRTFITALREYKRGRIISINDLVAFVSFREKNNMPLNNKSPFANAEQAVSLLSAHKAKGLEFEIVFVLSCLDVVWAGRGEPKRLTLPKNLPIEQGGDTEDDRLRLFYVALTRAKRHLILSSYTHGESGESMSPLRFLLPGETTEAHPSFEPQSVSVPEAPHTTEVLEASFLSFHTPPYRGEEEALLKHVLVDYQLSPTHLNNFLNVAAGGPQKFIETNLLLFPQAKSSSAVFGTAIHEALFRAVVYVKKHQTFPSTDMVIEWCHDALVRARISEHDTRVQKERAVKALTAFLGARAHELQGGDLVEVDFKAQGVLVGGAHVTGKIDRLHRCADGTFEVIDYKTGRALSFWDRGDEHDRIKLHQYRRQLCFYKLLVEGSRDFSKEKVSVGTLQFVEPDGKQMVSLSLPLDASSVERVAALARAVYTLIVQVRFPVVEHYTKDEQGIRQFEEDILAGTCRFL